MNGIQSNVIAVYSVVCVELKKSTHLLFLLLNIVLGQKAEH